MTKFAPLVALAAALPCLAAAPKPAPKPAQVPALEPAPDSPADAVPAAPPPPVNLLSGRESKLTAEERAAVGLAQEWMGHPEAPARGDDGSVVFVFGSRLPTVVCAPLYVCDLTLEAGEVVNDINVGDAVRWRITPATSGSGPSETTHIIVKPTDTGLTTNLVVTTDRRTYAVKLVSRKDDWMPTVAFRYPDAMRAEWLALRQRQQRERERVEQRTVLPTGQDVATLDFNYVLRGGKPAWRPIRVYADGVKTYVEFPATVAHGDLPALVALGSDKKEQLVNYRLVGDRFVVDKVLDRAVLVSGVGPGQEKVEIVHLPNRPAVVADVAGNR